MYAIAVFATTCSSCFAFATIFVRTSCTCEIPRRGTPVLSTGIVHVRTYSYTADRVGGFSTSYPHSDEHEALKRSVSPTVFCWEPVKWLAQGVRKLQKDARGAEFIFLSLSWSCCHLEPGGLTWLSWKGKWLYFFGYYISSERLYIIYHSEMFIW